MNWKFIFRQIAYSKKQAIILVLCIALSLMSIVALNGLQAGVDVSLSQNARELQAADIVIESNNPFSDNLSLAITSLEKEGKVETNANYEFLSVVRSSQNESMTAQIKLVGSKYPFYGVVELASKNQFSLKQGEVIVEQSLLDRLEISIGDTLKVGEATLTIVDVVVNEPDRPLDFFSLGPRVFVSSEDKDALQLFIPGSRIDYLYLLQVNDPNELTAIEEQLSAVSGERERVASYLNANSPIKTFLDNFLFFLSLLSTFTLLLAGLGIQSTLSSFMRDRTKTVAIMKTVGATTQYILLHFLCVVLLLGLIGTFVGIVLGVALQTALPIILQDILPEIIQTTVSPIVLVQGVLLGVVVTLLFAFLPLYSLKTLKPISILQKKAAHIPRKAYAAVVGLISLFFIVFIFLLLKNFIVGVSFVAGIVFVLLIASLLTKGSLWLLRKIKTPLLSVKQAIRGLFRPKNATHIIVVTLAASIAVLFCIFLIEQNLNKSYVETYPEGSPNMFFVDIQPHQVENFSNYVPVDTIFYPGIPGRVTSINDVAINRAEQPQRGDNIGREFRLTYREELLPDETLIDGSSLFGDYETPVSIHVSIVEMTGAKIGDTFEFNIQGIPIRAQVSSIRDNTQQAFSPFFYFVFPPEVLEKAPQTIFTAVYSDDTSTLRNTVAEAFPTVTIIDIREVINTIAQILTTLSQIIQFFTAFALLAGLLIIISSVFATQYERTQEAVYFKVLGAKKAFVRTVFIYENIIIGAISSFIGIAMAQIASYLIITRVFDLTYTAFVVESIVVMGITIIVIVCVGILASLSVLRKKPARFLQEHSEE